MGSRLWYWSITAVLAGGLLLAVPQRTAALQSRGKSGDETADSVVKTEDGLHFNVPPDWPIEKRGGVTGPIPIEEYLSQKFSAMDARVKNLEQQLESLGLHLRLLEEAAKKQKALQSGDHAP